MCHCDRISLSGSWGRDGSIAVYIAEGMNNGAIKTFADLLVPHRFVFRENRVPHYQRLFQQHDGKRQWWKVSQIKSANNRDSNSDHN